MITLKHQVQFVSTIYIKLQRMSMTEIILTDKWTCPTFWSQVKLNFISFPNCRTLKFHLKLKCNPTNEKIVAFENNDRELGRSCENYEVICEELV